MSDSDSHCVSARKRTQEKRVKLGCRPPAAPPPVELHPEKKQSAGRFLRSAAREIRKQQTSREPSCSGCRWPTTRRRREDDTDGGALHCGAVQRADGGDEWGSGIAARAETKEKRERADRPRRTISDVADATVSTRHAKGTSRAQTNQRHDDAKSAPQRQQPQPWPRDHPPPRECS